MVLALLGTIILGVALSVDETTTTGTGYREVADITGIINTSNDPYFTEYNPAYNLTRYSITGTDPIYTSGVTYTTMAAGQSSAYPVYTGAPSYSSGTFDLNGLSGAGLLSSGWDGVNIYRNNSNYSAGYSYTENPNFTNLEIIANALKTTTTTTITIDGGSGAVNPTRAYIMDNTPGETRFYPSLGSKAGSSVLLYGIGVDVYPQTRLSYYEESDWIIDVPSMTAKCVNANATYNAAEVWVAWGGNLVVNGGSSSQTIPSSISYTRADSVMEYMDPSKGVSLSNYGSGDMVTWSNSYYNNKLEMVLKGSSGDYIDMTLDGWTWNGSTWTNAADNRIAVRWTASNTTVYLSHLGTSVNIGKWNNLRLTVDMGQGTVTAEPITSFVNYNTFTTSEAIEIGTAYTGAFNSILFYDLGNSWYAPDMQITNTSVWMNTYGAVFRNALLNPTSYFPDYSTYRLKFGDFALIGDSLTINNVVLPITNNKISYNSKEYSLKGATIEYNGNVYLSGTEDGKEYNIDLGQIATNDVYFSGIWYAPVYFEEVYTTIEKQFDWIPYGFGLDYNAAVLVFIGLMAAVMFIAPLMKTHPKPMDMVIVVVAGFIGAGLLVV